MTDPSSAITISPPPSDHDRHSCLRTALGHYQTTIGVAELAVVDPFTRFLRWADLDNRPFGLALTLWQLGRFHAIQTAC